MPDGRLKNSVWYAATRAASSSVWISQAANAAVRVAAVALPRIWAGALAVPVVRSAIVVPAIRDLAVRGTAIIQAGIAPITYAEVPAYVDSQPRFYAVLSAVSRMLVHCPATYVDVNGHTDAIGRRRLLGHLSSDRQTGSPAGKVVRGGEPALECRSARSHSWCGCGRPVRCPPQVEGNDRQMTRLVRDQIRASAPYRRRGLRRSIASRSGS